MDLSRIKTYKSFTLLELIVVIIIIGVITALALPRMFSAIEYSRSAEALSTMTTIRSAMERCHLRGGGKCNTSKGPGTGTCCWLWPQAGQNPLDIDNPNTSPGSHFRYVSGGSPTFAYYYIDAVRNSLDGGRDGDYIHMKVGDGALLNKITICGTGAFKSMSPGDCSTPLIGGH